MVAVASTVAVMEEQVAPEAVVVADAKMLILLVLVELVDYLMVEMVLQHRPVILEITKAVMVEIAPEAAVAVAAPKETVILTHAVVMVDLVSLLSHTTRNYYFILLCLTIKKIISL